MSTLERITRKTLVHGCSMLEELPYTKDADEHLSNIIEYLQGMLHEVRRAVQYEEMQI